MREIKCQCGIKLSSERHSFTDGDGAYIIPVVFAKTIKDVKKFYKEETGGDYEKDTGEKPEKCFSKSLHNLTHIDEDEIFTEKAKEHSFGEVECWSDL